VKPFPKLHHYVPRFYLRRFGDADERLWVYDKHSGRTFRTTPERLAAEVHFYRVPELIGTDHDPLFLEKDLANLEGAVAGLTARWLNDLQTLAPMAALATTDDERHMMSYYIALQFFRTLEQREILALVAQEHGSYKSGVDAQEKINLHARMLCDGQVVPDLAARIYDSIWIFARSDAPTPFITSDNPVCIKTPDNRMWLKGPGIMSIGTYVVFPLSPSTVLYCKEPTHWHKLKPLDTTMSPVSFTKDMVDHENSGQAFMSTRFLMSPTDDFAFVREFIPSIGTELHASKDGHSTVTSAHSDE
jgi:hypothetical protein